MPLRRGLPRARFLVALAIVLLATGVVASVRYVDRAASPYAPNAKQVAAAESLVGTLPLPSGATSDLYDTTCGIPAAACVTSARSTPETLFRAEIAALKSRGASVMTVKCPLPVEDRDFGRCLGDLRFHGVHLTVSANNVTPAGVATPTWVAVIVDTNEPVILTTSRPLGSWQSLKVMPAGWHGSPTCLRPAARECNEYRVKLTEPGTPAAAQAVLRAAMTSAGYRIDLLHCYHAVGKGRSNCGVTASRFRSTAGRDQVLVIAIASTDGASTKVTLDASTGAF